jgi:hypothetical protein
MLDVGLYFLLYIFYFSLSFFYSSSSITFNPPLTLIRVLMVLGQHTYQILSRRLGGLGGLVATLVIWTTHRATGRDRTLDRLHHAGAPPEADPPVSR